MRMLTVLTLKRVFPITANLAMKAMDTLHVCVLCSGQNYDNNADVNETGAM